MLSTEVLFGFQLQSTFREGFAHISRIGRLVDAVSLTALVVTLGALIAATAQHRIVERGNATIRLLKVAGHLAASALFLLGVALSADIFVVLEYFLGRAWAIALAIVTFVLAMSCWFLLAWWKRRLFFPKESLPESETPDAHEKIQQMLREAWVALPGATGIFGFQLTVTTLAAFSQLPLRVQHIHFASLALIVLSIIVLLTPGPIHQFGFGGREDLRSHALGSRLISIALAPLSLGLTLDYYVAGGRMLGYGPPVVLLSALLLLTLIGSWFIYPWFVRKRALPSSSRGLEKPPPAPT
jgi:hypothetical protein